MWLSAQLRQGIHGNPISAVHPDGLGTSDRTDLVMETCQGLTDADRETDLVCRINGIRLQVS